MESKIKGRVAGLDALRLVAALLVICQHIGNYWGSDFILPVSRIAVFLFFLISGYFLYDENIDRIKRKCHKSIRKLCRIYLWGMLIYGMEALCVAITTGSFDVFRIGPWKLFVFFVSCSSPIFPYGNHFWFLIALIEALALISLVSTWRNPFGYKHISIVCLLLLFIGVMINQEFVPMKQAVLYAMPTIVMGGGNTES